MRSIVILLVAVMSVACAHAQPATTRTASLTFIGCKDVERTARDQHGRAFNVHGLSGITYAGDDVYWAVMDNSDKVVRLQVRLSHDGAIAAATIDCGLTVADRRDFEGIAFNKGSVFLSEETTPDVSEYSLVDGRRLRALPMPRVFQGANTIRNRTLESLALTSDGKSLWTANEHALVSDGSPQTPVEPMGATSRVRLLRYAIDANGQATPAEQLMYQTASVHDLAGINTLAELVALPDGKLLALERSGAQDFTGKRSIKTRIFLGSVEGATDVTEIRSLAPTTSPATAPATQPEREIKAVAKQLLFDGFVCDANGENLEGLCLGPQLGPGRWAVIGVVDDGDGPMQVSHTQIVAFELNLPGTGSGGNFGENPPTHE